MTRLLIGTLTLLCLCGGPSLRAEDRVLERDSLSRTFDVAADRPTRLVVDNVFGRIRVRSHDAQSVEMRVEKTIRGRSRQLHARAQVEVSLNISEEPGLIDVYVDGPFRETGRDRWSRLWHDRGYRVIYDFELTVPRKIELAVTTVDGGDLVVSGIRGPFEVVNVNGGVEMTDIGGSGSVKTVNGPVRVEFNSNPAGDSSFVTVNGDIEVFFRRGLSADLVLESSFGELWSEFEIRPMPSGPPIESFEAGRRVIRAEAGARVRVGSGGANHSFKTLNGDVLIRLAAAGADLDQSSPQPAG